MEGAALVGGMAVKEDMEKKKERIRDGLIGFQISKIGLLCPTLGSAMTVVERGNAVVKELTTTELADIQKMIASMDKFIGEMPSDDELYLLNFD